MSAERTAGPLLLRAIETDARNGNDGRADARILDATLAEVAAYGTRRTTIDGVARRAGVARVTVFRRFGTKQLLIDRLVVRELRRFLAEVDAAVAAVEDLGERVVNAFAICIGAARRHPLVARLVAVEPGWALEHLDRGEPSPLELARRVVAAHLRAAPEPRAPREADEVADVLVRLALSYVFLPGRAVDVADADGARSFARRMLVPIAVPSKASPP